MFHIECVEIKKNHEYKDQFYVLRVKFRWPSIVTEFLHTLQFDIL